MYYGSISKEVNKMKKAIYIVIAAAMLTACAKTPDNVKSSRSDSAPTQTQISSQSKPDDPQRESVQQKEPATEKVTEVDFEKSVSQSKKMILAGSYDNLTLDKSFTVIANAYPSSCQAVVTSELYNNADRIFSAFMSDDGYDKAKVSEHISEDNGVKTLEYEGEKKRCFVSSDGNVSIVEKEYMNKAVYGTNVPVNETKIFANSSDGAEISLGDTKLKLSDIRKTAEDECKRFASAVGDNVRLSVYSVSTVTEQSGETLAFVDCRQSFGNVPVFDTVPIKGDFLQMPAMQGTTVTINSENKAVQMNFRTGLEIKSSEKLKEILTAEYAFEKASRELAKNIGHTARSEELVLIPTAEQSDKELRSDVRQGGIVTLTPYWVIHFETGWYSEIYAAVNAVTGDVQYVRNRA